MTTTIDFSQVRTEDTLGNRVDPNQGASLVGFSQIGLNSIGRDVQNKLEDFLDSRDFVSIKDAISEAVFRNTTVAISSATTVKIPEDCSTLQIALDRISPFDIQTKVTLLIQAGHQLTTGVRVENGDYSQFRIESEDAEVKLRDDFSRSVDVFYGNNARLPVISILIDAQSRGRNIINIDKTSSVVVEELKGGKFCWGGGIYASGGSFVFARRSIFTDNAVNGATGSGITIWASFADLQYADVSRSGYYGCQAAHGAEVNFREGRADDCTRYGIRATDGAYMNFDGGFASRAGVNGVYAFNLGIINARGATAVGCNINVVGSLGSTINAAGGIFTGAIQDAVYSQNGTTITLNGANCSGAARYGIWSGGGLVTAATVNIQNSGSRGVYAEQGGQVFASSSNATGSGTGFYAENGGKIVAANSVATGCSSYGAVINTGSEFIASFADLSGAVQGGIRCLGGSKVVINGSNMQKGVSPDTGSTTADIQIFSGSTVVAHGVTGGAYLTPNTIQSEGILFR